MRDHISFKKNLYTNFNYHKKNIYKFSFKLFQYNIANHKINYPALSKVMCFFYTIEATRANFLSVLQFSFYLFLVIPVIPIRDKKFLLKYVG